MTTSTRCRLRATRRTTIAVLAAAIAGVGATSAWASAEEEQQGAALLGDVQSGRTSCSKLSASQAELIGENVMGRMVGSTTAHTAMNAQITARMGTRGEEQAHQFLGRRFAGCATGKAPAMFGSMMGMMGAGMMGASQGYGPNMHGGNAGGSAAGGTMGSGYGPSHTAHDGDMSTGAMLAIVLGSIGLLAVFIAVARRRITRRPTTPRVA